MVRSLGRKEPGNQSLRSRLPGAVGGLPPALLPGACLMEAKNRVGTGMQNVQRECPSGDRGHGLVEGGSPLGSGWKEARNRVLC